MSPLRLSRRTPALALLLPLWLVVVAREAGASASRGADATVNVPLEHPGYGLVERFEAKGWLSGVGDGIKPFSRGEMVRALATVDSLRTTGQAQLSAVEADPLHVRAKVMPGHPADLRQQLPDRQFLRSLCSLVHRSPRTLCVLIVR